MHNNFIKGVYLALILTLCFSLTACGTLGGKLGQMVLDGIENMGSSAESDTLDLPETAEPEIEVSTTKTPEKEPQKTEAPTTKVPETEPPKTEAPTTKEPETELPTIETEPDIVLPDPVYTAMSFDECEMWMSGCAPVAFFVPGHASDWDGVALVEDYKVEQIHYKGWVAFYSHIIGEFGYQIDDNEPVFDTSFADTTEQTVIDAALASGGKSASRMDIAIPVKDLAGEHTIKTLVRDAAGTIELLSEFTLIKAADPNMPIFLLDADDIYSCAFNANDVANAEVSDDGSYITLTNGEIGDPYITFSALNVSARYVVVKYRTTVILSDCNFFVGSSGSVANGIGDLSAPLLYNADGRWHFALIDISTIDAVNDQNWISYLRYDFYTNGQNQSIDVAYIAGFGSVEAAQAYFDNSMSVEDSHFSFATNVNDFGIGTEINFTDIANYFICDLPLGGCGVVKDNGVKAYEMANINEIYTDVDSAYFVKANVLYCDGNAALFVRGYHQVNSADVIASFDPDNGIYKINNYYETDCVKGGGGFGGAGIYFTISGGMSGDMNNATLGIVIKHYDPSSLTRVGNTILSIPCQGTTLTVADNGYTVSVMVEDQLLATIELIGAQSYADIIEVSPYGQFASQAIVKLCDGREIEIEDTLVAAATTHSQIGIAARLGTFRFSSLEVGGYSEIDIPAFEIENSNPKDPNAPIDVATPKYLAAVAMAGSSNQISSAVLSNDGTYVTLSSGQGGDPYFFVLPSGALVKGVRYVGLKYRTTVDGGEEFDGEFFVGSTAISGEVDELQFDYIADGQWHVILLDVSDVEAVNDEGLVNYLRYDFFASTEYASIDVAGIGLFSSYEAAKAYYGDEIADDTAPKNPAEPESPMTT